MILARKAKRVGKGNRFQISNVLRSCSVRWIGGGELLMAASYSYRSDSIGSNREAFQAG